MHRPAIGFIGQLLARITVEVQKPDPRALSHESTNRVRPDPRSTTGNEDRLAFEAWIDGKSHGRLPS